jgi:hypothetical protein
MKLRVTHDVKGNISGLVTQPDDAPPGGVAAGPGQFVTQVDAPDRIGDLVDEKGLTRLVDLARSYRVETKFEGKLTKKSSAK